MNKIGFLEFFGSFLPPHNLRPALADAKIVAGELDRESRSLEAEVEVFMVELLGFTEELVVLHI